MLHTISQHEEVRLHMQYYRCVSSRIWLSMALCTNSSPSTNWRVGSEK
jgi:hypothetical protein